MLPWSPPVRQVRCDFEALVRDDHDLIDRILEMENLVCMAVGSPSGGDPAPAGSCEAMHATVDSTTALSAPLVPELSARVILHGLRSAALNGFMGTIVVA